MYYDGNELYRYLVEQNLTDRYFWVSGNMWTLLYSDSDGQPLLLCFVSRADREEDLDQPATVEEIQAFRRFSLLANRSGLPLVSLRFVEGFERPCETFRFKVYRAGTAAERVSSEELLARLKELGLPLQDEAAEKRVNDKVSSSFHQWQRTHMGSRVIATDLDLIRFSEGEIDTLYELKRSYLALDEWNPFRTDRVNYLAGANLARMLGISYRVVYNVRHTKPEFYDDISQLKVYDMNQGWPGECLGQFAVEDYFN